MGGMCSLSVNYLNFFYFVLIIDGMHSIYQYFFNCICTLPHNIFPPGAIQLNLSEVSCIFGFVFGCCSAGFWKVTPLAGLTSGFLNLGSLWLLKKNIANDTTMAMNVIMLIYYACTLNR